MAGYCAALGTRDINVVIYCGTRPNILPIYRAMMSPALHPWIRMPSRRWISTDRPTPYRNWMDHRVITLHDPAMEPWYYHLVLGLLTT